MRTAVFLHQIRERMGHLSLDALAIGCGPCMESLAAMQADSTLGCPIVDVNRLVVDAAGKADDTGRRMYHASCRDSLESEGEALLAALGLPFVVAPHCCGEAGTLTLIRPDIAAAMRSRKGDAFRFAGWEPGAKKMVFTNCPACLSGLGKQENLGIRVRHRIEEVAIGMDGAGGLETTNGWRERAQAIAL